MHISLINIHNNIFLNVSSEQMGRTKEAYIARRK
jgi:hypothetical protein